MPPRALRDPPQTVETVGISPEQQRALADQGIAYNQAYGTWTKTVQQGKGVYSEQVDPIVELWKLQQLHAQVEYTDTVAVQFLGEMSITTLAIIQKVARVSHET